MVSYGELFLLEIVSAYLNKNNQDNQWVDIRKVLITNSHFQEAKVDYKATKENSEKAFNFSNQSIYITQGFIGSTEKGETTTLGREGSDFTAAVLANVLNAEKIGGLERC